MMNLTHFVGTVMADGRPRARVLGITRGTTLVRRDWLRRRVIRFRLVAPTELFRRRVAKFPRLVEERVSCAPRSVPAGLRQAQVALRPAHVGAGASIDFDRFAFFDKQRHVDRFSGFEFCRFGHVAGGIAPHTLGRVDHFEVDR